ncbi:rod shape-determining protein MreD [Paracoccus sp. MC1862]|uniref:rod shape-determining protein MreD n=1 Tax=Paracoccus sp. MC1862 TaxID=2760307 RepID=UPI00160123B7|nr:rod shape-determining protein MreD [Paracoccus sp. MC1862]MBB1499300.1 rod shape-determining protein MreD [Paracoccus sp. MC1862]QQO46040.1 rod shape-determining protein MreD [Paracoccus sp. MC1862]
MPVPYRHRQLLGLTLYLLASLALIVVALLPLAPGRIGWPGPDWLLALTFAWVLRRPEQVPVLAIAAVMLIADILTLQPPGLGAALAVMATEVARQRQQRWRDQGFLVEWLRVAMLMGLMVLAERVIRTVFLVPPTLAPLPPPGQDVLRLIATIGAYPLVAGMLSALGLRRSRRGAFELG